MKRPSPALVIACLALFVALSGTSYAALKLPKNSVGPAQIKKNSVSSTKVKDGSLLAKDFKAGQIPTGAKGEKGERGEKGDKGDAGATGAQGPAVSASADTNSGTITTSSTTVISLGNIYVRSTGRIVVGSSSRLLIDSSVYMAQSSGSSVLVACYLQYFKYPSGSVLSVPYSTTFLTVPTGVASRFPLTGRVDVAAGEYDVAVVCNTNSGTVGSTANLNVIATDQ
ncbi:MAG: collagen-like protein [Solirubrobacterales bacterium]